MPDDVSKKREAPISYRPPAALREEFLRRIQRSGLSTSAFITRAIFDREVPRQSRRPPVERAELARLLGQCARLRDELHEIGLAQGEDSGVALVVEAAKDELIAMRAALLKAMGRAP